LAQSRFSQALLAIGAILEKAAPPLDKPQQLYYDMTTFCLRLATRAGFQAPIAPLSGRLQ
jgi:hypothetical protein